MAILNRAQFLAAPLPSMEVPLPEYGGTVRIRAMTHSERIALLDAITENERLVQDYEADQAASEENRTGVAKVERLDFMIVQLCFMIVDENNEQVFGLKDYEVVRSLSYPSIAYLYQQAMKLENRSEEAFDTVKKNSSLTTTAGSRSVSRSNSGARSRNSKRV